MGVLDFLFEGSPPPSTTTYGTTVENMPQWLSDYTQALIARANMVAAEPYQAYQGPRVAGFTDDQNNAFDVIRNNVGDWNDEFDTSKAMTGGALTQAMPFLNNAAQNTPSQIQSYMDPYVGNVIDRAKLEANRNWEENIQPGISGRFIKGGQSGSTAHQERMLQGGRDVTEGLNSQAMAALSDAYKTAGSQYGADAARQVDIGKSVGALGLQGGQQMAGLATLQQALGGRDAASLEALGATQQQQNQRNLDTAYGDFQAQREYPRQQVDWMSSIIRGMPHDTTRTTSETGPANAYQPSPISQLLSLYGLYKDVTKARGGVVRKGEGSRPHDSLGPQLVSHYNKKKKEIESEKKLAHGGVVHIEGPLAGYGRYAEGGRVGSLRRAVGLFREMMADQDLPAEMQPKSDTEAAQLIQDYGRDNPTRRDVLGYLDDYRRRVPSVKKIRPKARKAHGGLACLEQ